MTIVAICSIIALPFVWINTLRMFFAKKMNHSGKTRKLSKEKLELINKPKQIDKLPPFNHPDRQGKYKLTGLGKKKANKYALHDLIPLYKNNEFVAGVSYTTGYKNKYLFLFDYKNMKNVPKKLKGKRQYIGNELNYRAGNIYFTKKNLKDYEVLPVKYNEDDLHKLLSKRKSNLDKYIEFINKK